MKIYLQSLNYDLWNIVEASYTKPTTNYNAWSEDQKKNANLDAKAMNALFCALTKEEFNRVSTATSAHQIWHTLQVTHEGTNKVKESKISVLVHRFELFKMEENETISEMVTRFTDITNTLASLGKDYTQVERVRKILRALTPEWEKKTTAIEEANDLSTMTLENLIGNLMAYEVQLEERKKDERQHRSKKKELAFHASSDTDNDDEEEMAMLSKKFRKFLKQGKFKCFNCDKPGHMKMDCPLLKKKDKYKSKKFRKKKNYEASSEYSDSSSSDEEESTEHVNLCYMAIEDEEVSFSELSDAFNELFMNLKNEKLKNRFLLKENEKLLQENSVYALQCSSINSQQDETENVISFLKTENEKFIKENIFLKMETKSLNDRISILDKDMLVFKKKYEDLMQNVTKFNKGKEKLNDLLSFQNLSHDNHGIGFIAKSSCYNHPYSYFVKSKTKKSKFIWIPKNLNVYDKNTYIASYMHDICDSCNYVYTNRWKPNSKWIWSPKG